MSNPMFSIIIPVYKAENTLNRCVQSILSQEYINWELLLIDDGSPDNSGKLCDTFSKKDARIKTFHKKNGGVSSARNLGLDHAKGKWCVFIDSDDWLDGQVLSLISKAYQDDKLLIFNVLNIKGGLTTVSRIPPLSLNGEKFRRNIYKFLFYDVLLAPWAKFFSMDIIREHNIRFDEEIKWAEDRLFNLSFISHINSIRFLGEGSYAYMCPTSDDNIMKYHVTPSMLLKLRDSLKNIASCMKGFKHISMTYNFLWRTMEKIYLFDNSFDVNIRNSFYKGNLTISSIIDNFLWWHPLNGIMFIYCSLSKSTRSNRLLRKFILSK